MQLFLSNHDLDRLKILASQMGVPVVYHSHQEHFHYMVGPDGNLQMMASETWLVDLFEELDKRISRLETQYEPY